jgi:hypothetical protein
LGGKTGWARFGFPPNGGTNANGSIVGFNYDGTDFSSLPFRAQFVTYFKDGYNEYRQSDGSGGWGIATSNYGTYASNGNGNVREFAIPWTAISGGIPSSFLFFGYLTSSGGYVYGQVPNDNPGAFIGTSATYTQFFAVNSTSNGSSTPPFSIETNSSNYPTVVPFSAFTAKVEISGTPPTGFQVNSSFTLGNTSNGINPLSEAVTLQLGGFSITIPKNSFTKTPKGGYVYQGTIGGVAVQFRIAPVTSTSFTLQAQGSGATGFPTTNPVTVGLTIGDDTGTVQVTAQFQ